MDQVKKSFNLGIFVIEFTKHTNFLLSGSLCLLSVLCETMNYTEFCLIF
jgi:hypothetical protein